jgi:hypothetical protein
MHHPFTSRSAHVTMLGFSAMIVILLLASSGVRAADVSCSDSDATAQFSNGNNIYQKGTVTRNGYTDDPALSDVCTSSTELRESFCSGTSWAVGSHTCANGCTNGACNNPPAATCQEYDGGDAPNTAGFARMASETEGEVSKKLDVCEGNLVREQTCTTSTQISEILHECPYGCSNGACIQGSPGSTSSSSTPACTADTRICPGGTSVSRDPALNCEFKSCPYVPRSSSSSSFSSSSTPSSASSSSASSASSLSPRLRQVAKRCARFSPLRQKRIRACVLLNGQK